MASKLVAFRIVADATALSRRLLLLVVVCIVLCHRGATASFFCDGGCSGHGKCDGSTGRCVCFPGFIGTTCKSMQCPFGIAWVDYASGVDTAHGMAECSNMGLCDRMTGNCKCASGFEGPACERMSCPTCVFGRCISMREAASIQDNTNFFVSTTYNVWDADKIFGCQCDLGYYGYDCSQRGCPKGDDPATTGQVNEVQTLTCQCDGCTGTFVIIFRRRVTINLSPTDTPATLQTALQNLETIYGAVTVNSASPTICTAAGATTTITFTNNPGDLPNLQYQSRLSGGTSAISVVETVKGTREEVFCSNRGLCDFSSGVCACQAGFTSSSGALLTAGTRGDCGLGTPTVCPTTSNGACDGHGRCSGGPSYVCICNNGFTGYDCSQRTCPNGYAWFDGATAPDTAHALAPCSNRGYCDPKSGNCVCAPQFTGSACEQLKCPVSTATCSGHGYCKTMQQLAQSAASNGVLLGYTYGNTLNNPYTWDYNKIQGCDCTEGYYLGPFAGQIGDFHDYDCSTSQFCPLGADPNEVGKVNEKQTITCVADGGSFTIKFREHTSGSIAFNANAATVAAALLQMGSITSAVVTFGAGTTVCDATAIVTTVEFTYEQGDLPMMTTTSSLTNSGGPVVLTVAEAQKGTKANIECSSRGVCDRLTGICSCFNMYLSSDGDGNAGARGDCGYRVPYTTISLA